MVTVRIKSTNFDDINNLLEKLILELKITLKDSCVGVYLLGSLVWGDFKYHESDIDILVIVKKDINNNNLNNLNKIHNLLIQYFPVWNNRIEIAYIAKDTLRACLESARFH